MVSDQRYTQGMWQINATSDLALDSKPEKNTLMGQLAKF